MRELLQATYTMTRRKLFLEAVFFSLFLVTFVGVCFSIYDVHKAFQTNDALIDLFLDEEFEGATYKKVRPYACLPAHRIWQRSRAGRAAKPGHAVRAPLFTRTKQLRYARNFARNSQTAN